MSTQQVLFALIRTVICGEAVSEEIRSSCTKETLERVYTLAAKHDLAHLVGQAVSKLGLPESETLSKCKQAAMQAFMRYARQSYEYTHCCKALEDAQIPFIPLKGSILRELYPEPWLRNSCDIDILVKEDMLDTAVAALADSLGYTAGTKGDHDITLTAPSGVHLELHYDTIQQRYEAGTSRSVLCRIWEDSHCAEGKRFQRCLSDEMFYFYHIAHMAKHFENGGCGIRPFLDIWILHNRIDPNKEKRDALLQEGGLLNFSQGALKLSRVWFSGAAPDSLTMQMEQYILFGGTYGNLTNRAAYGQVKSGGKLQYLLKQRIFMPYDYLKAEYPILKDKKYLTPLYQGVRWVRMLRSGGLHRHTSEMLTNLHTTDTTRETTAQMLKQLGL